MKSIKLKKKGFILVETIFFLCLFFLTQFNIILYDPLEDNNNKFRLPRQSNSNINITTLENTTYVKPMYGYYAGTNSFEQNEDGQEPSWFNVVSTGGGTVQVISDLDDHYKVLELHDTSATNNTYVSRLLGAIPHFGTIEFWMRTDDAEKLSVFSLKGGLTFQDLAVLRIESNRFQCFNGTDWTNITIANSDVWYNIRIDFECTSGGYQGLSQYTWEAYVNGRGFGGCLFANNYDFANVMVFYTDFLHGLSNYSYFIDAIAFSWDDFYTVGDNANCGMLLDFQAPSNLTWIGYSLDNAPNKTIFGPTVFPFPDGDGVHHIQVFGTDSEDNLYQSDKRFFTVDKPYLLLVHGLNGGPDSFEDLLMDATTDWNRNGINDYKDYYGSQNVFALESYYDSKTTRPEFDGIVESSSIENVSRALKEYIINDHDDEIIKDNLDLLAHSLGGLVIRYMVKEYYYEFLQEGITVQHVAISGSPSHGNWGDNAVFLDLTKPDNFWSYESTKNCANGLEMVTISEFLAELNADDETPYNVLYNTYRGGGLPDISYYGVLGIGGIIHNMEKYNMTLINQIAAQIDTYGDTLVVQGSVVLSGAVNNRIYWGASHAALKEEGFIVRQVLWDLRSYLSPSLEITFPQNATYNKPNEGHYLATNGFENDQKNFKPQWFEHVITEGGTAQVVDSVGNHSKVLKLYDTSDETNVYVDKTLFFLQYFGSIEYWARTDDAEKLSGFHLNGGIVLADLVTLRIRFNQFHYFDGSEWHPITEAQSDKWYHIRIDFDCTSGGYLGLSQYHWRLFIDGINYGMFPFANNKSYAKYIMFYTDFLFGLSDYSYYIDAVGLSYDAHYFIGDNYNEGLLLDLDYNFQPEWMQYSLDGGSNVTILGSAVIPFPDEGTHTLQVFSKELSGETIESEIMYFTIDTTKPEILIHEPFAGTFFGTEAPEFNVSMSELHPERMWYTIDYGNVNITVNDFFGTINQTEWDKKNSEAITLRFYANDSSGLENYDEVTIYKDIDPPTSMISYIPYSGTNIVNKSSQFTITANDGLGSGVSIIRYKINDSIWFEYTGVFNLSSYDYGSYLISYYSVDTIGNIEIEHSILVILKELSSAKEPKIHGFNLLLVFSLLGLVVFLLMKRDIKHL